MTAAFRKHQGQPTETHNPITLSQTEQHVETIRFHHDDLRYSSSSRHTDERLDLRQRAGMNEQHAPGGSHALSHASTVAQHGYGHDDTTANLPSMTQHPSLSVAIEAPPPSDFDMLPPVPSTHASWQALHDYAQSHAAAHGYALSINTTAKNRSRIKLACVCYGQPKNTHKLTPETRVRKNRVSYKTGCKMWVDGKKQDNGTWVLRVGEAQHNHRGRPSEDWAVQRKRTWGVVGGRIGVGGVTAKEETIQNGTMTKETAETAEPAADGVELRPMAIHKLERGGLIWKIVEQEMLRKGESGQGRDRGVGRTVEVLQGRLPGIRIFKRDVYNIRAQIRKARKAAGQQIGEGLEESEPEDEEEYEGADDNDVDEESSIGQAVKVPNIPHRIEQHHDRASFRCPVIPQQIDPSLTASHINNSTQPLPSSVLVESEAYEVEQLRKENAELRRLLSEKTDEVKKKTIEIASLRTQADYMAMTSGTDGRGR
ncbi:hypothetical protein J1614_006070 [Plenodomus biglobosus]|nr:hypothetical protein J1614_006070 [Plenodomus biglobosus]